MSIVFIEVIEDGVLAENTTAQFYVSTFNGSADTFTELFDTPTTKVGAGDKLVQVSTDESKLVYATVQNGLKSTEGSIELDIDGLPETDVHEPTMRIPVSDGVDQKSIPLSGLSTSLQSSAMTKADFFALAEKRKRDGAGSGFSEWGNHSSNTPHIAINQGLWAASQSSPNNFTKSLYIGNFVPSDVGGESRTYYPISVANGVQHRLDQINSNNSVGNTFNLPPAPNGTKTLDSATGEVVQHASAAAAFASETATTKVTTTRKDLVLLESWHESIEDKDVVFPLGNTQYGANNDQNGIGTTPITSYGVAQGYSAFGEWDTVTVGNGRRWSTLPEADKRKYLADPDNNIYFDAEVGKFIQVRYRIRVIEGLGDEWENVSTQINALLRYSNASVTRVTPRGTSVSVDDMNNGGVYFYSKSDVLNTTKEDGEFQARLTTGQPIGTAHNGLCFAIPIALVQRLNQGAYHPEFNSEGCGPYWRSDTDGNAPWYLAGVMAANKIHSQADCFNFHDRDAVGLTHIGWPTSLAGVPWGKIGGASGRSDQYEFYDAIYAGLVEDLRLNSNKQDTGRLLEDAIRKDVAGETRGKGKLPFTGVAIFTTTSSNSSSNGSQLPSGWLNQSIDYVGGYATVLDSSNNILVNRARITSTATTPTLDAVNWDAGDGTFNRVSGQEYRTVIEYNLTPEYDSLPWVDIIGDPVRIAATFPNGVVGQWIPNIPDSTGKAYFANAKVNQANPSYEITDNDGASWSTGTYGSFNTVTNSLTTNNPTGRVILWHYETLSDFTESAANSEVVGAVGDVYYGCYSTVLEGNRLQPSLTGTISTSNTAGRSPYGYVPLVDRLWYKNKFLSNVADYYPTHSPIMMSAPANDSPAVKALYTLTEKDGLLYMQYHWSELKHTPLAPVVKSGTDNTLTAIGTTYKVTSGAFQGRLFTSVTATFATFDDGSMYLVMDELRRVSDAAVMYVQYRSGWGDDSAIPVVNNESTKVDLNGTTVEVGCHHGMIPIGIADKTQSL